jgi:hypothetical protein
MLTLCGCDLLWLCRFPLRSNSNCIFDLLISTNGKVAICFTSFTSKLGNPLKLNYVGKVTEIATTEKGKTYLLV